MPINTQKEIYLKLEQVHKSRELRLLATGQDFGELDFLDLLKSGLSIHIFRNQKRLLKNSLKVLKSRTLSSWTFNGFSGEPNNQPKEYFDFVFWATEPNQFDQQIEVANQLVKEGRKVAFVFSNDKLFNYSGSLQFPILDFRIPKRGLKPFKVEAKGGLKLFPHLQVQIKEFLYPFARDVQRALDLFERFEFKHLVVGHDLSNTGRITAKIAERFRVPTSCIMHGALSFEYEKDNCAVDTIFVFGLRDQRLFNNYVSPKGKTEVVLSGAPYLDKYSFDSKFKPLNSVETPTILVANSGPGTSVSLENHLSTVRGIGNLASNYPKINFLIKLHRKDSVEYYGELVKLENVQIVDQKMAAGKSIFQYMIDAHLLITGASTSALEASLLELPAISFDPQGELSSTYFMKDKATIYCSSYDQLERTVVDFLDGNNPMPRPFKEIQKDFFYSNDRRASARISKYLLERIHLSVPQ